jgi:hypothetical protein
MRAKIDTQSEEAAGALTPSLARGGRARAPRPVTVRLPAVAPDV